MGAHESGRVVVRPDSISVVIPTIYANPILLARARNGVYATGATLVVADDPNASFAENCNTGAQYAPGEILVFLNDDTEPQDGWLGALCRPFDDPRVGITGARLTYPDGRIQHAGVYLDSPGGVLTAHNVLTDEPSREVEAVTGACMAVRREAWTQLGGFDVGYINGYEDVDLCLRARAEGWQVWYCADAHVIHHESQSGPARWTHVRENIERLQVIHGDHRSE